MGGEALQTHFNVHINHLQMSMSKRKPNPNVSMPAGMERKMKMDDYPDYVAEVAPEDRQEWNKEEQEFLKLPKVPDVRREKIKVKPLTEGQIKRLAGKQGFETKGRKIYYDLVKLAEDEQTKILYSQFDGYGDQCLELANEIYGNFYGRVKPKDVVLLTFGEGMEGYDEFKEEDQTITQFGHCDEPSGMEGMPSETPILITCFVVITRRGETRFYFDINMKELLGDGTQSVKGNKFKWVLWRLRMAHKLAFEIQAQADRI